MSSKNFILKTVCVPDSLEEVRKIFLSNTLTGFTINLPRTNSFISLTSIQQARVYNTLLKRIITQLHNEYKRVFQYRYVEERCQDGNLHIHGMVECPHDPLLKEPFLVTDIAVIAHKQLQKKYRGFGYSDPYHRYRSPLCTTQHMHTEEEAHRWYQYMWKEQR